MSSYQVQQAESVPFRGHNGDTGEAYYARPLRAGKFPGIVVIHHLPGWDEWTTEVVRKFAHHGYAAISPHLYFREGNDSPDDVGARMRAAGGVADAQVMGDVRRDGVFALPAQQQRQDRRDRFLLRRPPYLSGRLHAVGIDAAVDCWGGNVVVDDPKLLDARRPVAPIDFTEKLACPLLGIFGNDDADPTADQVNRTEAVLKKFGKTYEFHRYDGAGHAFFNTYRDAYRPDQALDGWRKVLAFLKRNLAASAASIAAE